MPQFRRYDLEQLSINNKNGRIEILAVEVTLNKEKWLFISVYKQPKVSIRLFTECVDDIMMKCINYDINIVMLGDFNVNMLKTNDLMDCLDVNGLKNLVRDTTCVKGTPSIIDLIVTNKPKRFTKSTCVDTGLSDFHSLVCIATKLHIPTLKLKTFQYRSYKTFNNESFLYDLSVIPFHITEIFDDVDDSYWAWNELTMQVVNEHAPIKTKTMKGSRVPYMNGELRRAINVRNMFKRKYDKCKTTLNWNKYRYQRNLVTQLRKRSMNNYIHNKCSNNTSSHCNGKEFWDTIKPLISHKCNIKNDNIILLRNNEVFTQPDAVASIFNDYFTNIAENIGSDDSIKDEDNVLSCLVSHSDHDSITNIKEFMKSAGTNNAFYFHDIDVNVIRSHLNKLKCNKATGYDLLPSRLLRIGCDILCYSICYLVNTSFRICSFPNSLKYAEIRPIHKKDSNLDVCNYRPVSILPGMSKIFEREMVNQLYAYFDNIFSPFISGFRPQHSCETVLMSLIENIKQSLDDGKIICVLLMDLSRAFDCIPYKLFIAKLHAYGLSMSACELMYSYYCNRKQRVKLGNCTSEWQYIYKGAAQGSIMGPQSYNIFSNDMLLLINDDVQIYNYADDNTLVCSGYNYDDVKDKLLHNVINVISWFEDNHMKINPDKFQYIVFGKYENVDNFVIGNNIITPQNCVKVLGLQLDNKLRFDDHVSQLCNKAGKQVQVLSRLCKVLTQANKMLLYSSFVECYFNYCCIIWHFCSNANTYKLEKLQKKALKFITLDFRSTYCELMNKCNKRPLYIVRISKFIEMVHKIINNACPSYLYNCIKSRKTTFNLRHTNNLCIPKFKTITYGKRSFNYMAPFHWNKLPNEFKNKNTLKGLKIALSSWTPNCKCGFCVQCAIFNM